MAVPRVGVGLRENDQVTMGRADRQGDLFDDVVRFCEDSLPGNSIYGFLARERDRLFPDELFTDLFSRPGCTRCSRCRPIDHDRGWGMAGVT